MRLSPLRLLLVSMLLACGGGPGGQEARPGRPMGQATFPSGRRFILELAIQPGEQARGYMGRDAIGEDEGMLFLNPRPRVRYFWMKNCLVPIDIIWLSADHIVVAIEHSAPPCKKDPCPSYGPPVPTRDILEVRGGAAAAEGLKVGDRIAIVTDEIRP